MSEKLASDEANVVDKFLEDKEEEGMPPSKPRKAPAPKLAVKANEGNYSEKLYKDEKERSQSIEEISQPTELGDREDAEDLQREADEVKARLEAEKKFEKAKGRRKKQINRNGTRIMGTKRYNPFLFGGSVGSLMSSFGSNFETKKKQDLRKALYADDPLQLYLVKGWYKLLTKDDIADNESVTSNQNEKRKNKVFNFLKSHKKQRQYQIDKKSTLTPVQIKAINTIARKSHMEALDEDEIGMIEDRLNAENPSGAGCFGFIKNCFNMIVSKREEKEQAKRRKTGDTDLSITASEAQENIQRTAMVKSSRPSSKKKMTTAVKGECIFCHRRVKPSECLKVEEGNPEDEPVSIECVKCELCRVRVTKVSALKARQNNKPSLCNKCVINVEQSREAQSQLHSEGVAPRPGEYLPLVPQGCKLFLPIQIVGMTGEPAIGMIAMCSDTGIQLRKRDMSQVRHNGPESLLAVTPTKDKLRTTLRADMKIAAAGFGKEIAMKITAASGLLKNPLEENYVFKRDESSLQYDLRQGIKANLSISYYISSKDTIKSLNLANLRPESLIFAGTLTKDIGPFLSGHKVAVQEEDISTTGKNVFLRGRYEHGILYEWTITLLLDADGSSLTPVRLDLNLRLPQL